MDSKKGKKSGQNWGKKWCFLGKNGVILKCSEAQNKRI